MVFSSVTLRFVSLFALALLGLEAFRIPKEVLNQDFSRIYYSREENLIWQTEAKNGSFREWSAFSTFPEHLVRAIILSEDKRFYSHPGFDPIAIGRAARDSWEAGRIVGGGSTIPQQLARIIHPEWRKLWSPIRKVLEIFYSVRLVYSLDRKDILEGYLNSVAVKSWMEGFPIAARVYFQKNHRFLSEEESIGLVVLIQNPSQKSEEFRIRFRRLAEKMNYTDPIDWSYLEDHLFHKYSPNLRSSEIGSENYHFTRWLTKAFPNQKGSILTTLSSELNRAVYSIVISELEILARYNATNASVIVWEKDAQSPNTLRLVSMIGSKNFFDWDAGQVNGVLAYRDAGSILKPFLYGACIDRGLFTVNSILRDEEFAIKQISESGSHMELFYPRNADLTYWGDLTLAEALANSRNIPAYKAIDKLGPTEFRRYLEQLEMRHLDHPTEHYGHGLAMGTGGVSLFQITHAYGSFLFSGILPHLNLGKNNLQISQSSDLQISPTDEELGKLEIRFGRRVLGSETASEIRSILSSKELRRTAFGERGFLDFPYPIGVKTGTSKDYTNSWTIGFSDRYVVGVWVGNFSGRKMEKVSGNWGAGRIFQSVMRYLNESNPSQDLSSDLISSTSVCRKTGLLPGNTCPLVRLHMRKTHFPKEICSVHNGGVKNEEPLVIGSQENSGLQVRYGGHPKSQMNSNSSFDARAGSNPDIHSSLSEMPRIKSPMDNQVFFISEKIPLSAQEIPLILEFIGKKEDRLRVIWNGSKDLVIGLDGRSRVPVHLGQNRIELKDGSNLIQSVQFEVKVKH